MLLAVTAVALAVAIAAVRSVIGPAPARASSTQDAMFEDDAQLLSNPDGTLMRYRLLGVQVARVRVVWSAIAPHPLSHKPPAKFDAADPAAYPQVNWSALDRIIGTAQRLGIRVNLDLAGGAPLWATGPGAPTDKPHPNWDPSPGAFGAFARAVGERYSGRYTPAGSSAPLPHVDYWSVWNEPDYGPSLAPQGVAHHLAIENSPRMYRNLVDTAWRALQGTGHDQDTFIFGELAPRGWNNWGAFSGMKPLVFLRALYCVDRSYRELLGGAAAARGCPTTAGGSSRFRAAHPALFRATGFSVHPYMRWYTPNREAQPDRDYSSLGELGGLERALDRLQRVYGSSRRLPIYDTEFGYITSPPKHPIKRSPWVSQATAAYYLNWAEYISWRDPRVQSFNQYLLYDPVPALASNDYGGFASGLLNHNGAQKATYSAWRLPLYLPVTSTRRGHSLEVWGCARPAYFATTDPGAGAQSVQIQFQAGSRGPFATLETVPITNRHGYFDTHIVVPSSGMVRLTWTYPPLDPLLAPGYPTYSRQVQVTLR
jgi:hypothetical protein